MDGVIESGNDLLPFPAGIEAGCGTFLSVKPSTVAPWSHKPVFDPKQTNQPSCGEIIKKQYMNDQRLEATITVSVDRERRLTYERTGMLRWVQGPEIWDCHLHSDLLWAHNDSTFLFFTIVVMSLSIRLLYSDTGRFASLLPHYGVMLGSIRKVTQGSCCWKHYLGSLFLALCRKVATPGIWCMHVYVSWKRSGYCTVLHFSHPPRVLVFVWGFIEVVRIYPVLMPLSVHVCVCVWQGRREVWIKPEAEREREM